MSEIDAIEDVPLFSQMPRDQVALIAAAAERRPYEAGEIIFR